MSTSRGRPPRGLRVAGGIIGSTMAHCASVRSEGYTFRERPSCSICAHSSAEGICANYLTNPLLCQVMFPDRLLDLLSASLLTPVASRNLLLYQSLLTSISCRHANVRR